MKELQIPNGYFHLWRNYLAEQGVNGLEIKQIQPYKKQIENILDAPIAQQSSYPLFWNIIEITQKQLDKPQLIFEMAKGVKPEHFGVLGYMATRSTSFAEALSYILKFSRLVIDGDEIIPMQMHQEQQNIILSWPYIDDDFNLINELTNALMIELGRKIVPLDNFPLRRVGFAHSAQMAQFHYQKFYVCEVVFDQPDYTLVMSTESLNIQIQQADPSLLQLLIQQAEEAIASKPNHENMARQLHLIIAEYLKIQQQAPKIEDIAKELHVSVRTLQRQLKDLGSSFKQILEAERMKHCEKLLAQQMSLTDIALQLGYSDQSALARAFKAHTGQTLLQMKHQLKEDKNQSL